MTCWIWVQGWKGLLSATFDERGQPWMMEAKTTIEDLPHPPSAEPYTLEGFLESWRAPREIRQ